MQIKIVVPIFGIFLAAACQQQPAPAALPTPVESVQVNQCSKDTDCKGDRICESGKCTAPSQSVSSTPTPAQKESATAPTNASKTTKDQELVSLKDLVSSENTQNCFPPVDDVQLIGTIKKRNYLSDGATLAGVVVEEADGQRYIANLDTEHLAAKSSFAATEVSQVLTLGRHLKIRMLGCGAGGDYILVREIHS